MLPQPISPTAKINQDKSFTVPGLHPSTYKVYGVIPARVYHAAFGSKQSEWIYTGLSGSLVLGKDRGVVDGQGYWFRLLDDTGKTIWIFKMPATGFDYHVDKPFFHIFRGCSRKFGFLYSDDIEAAGFAKKVIGRAMPRAPVESPLSASLRTTEIPRTIRSRLASSTMGRLSPTIISSPTKNSFVHVAHVGAKKTTATPDPDDGELSWTMVLAELPDSGVSAATILEQHDIAEEYMKRPPTPMNDSKQNLKPHKVRRKPSPKVLV